MEQPVLDIKPGGAEAPDRISASQPPRSIVVFVLSLFTAAVVAMMMLIHYIPHATSFTPEALDVFLQSHGRRVFIFTAAMMACCGVLGGCPFDIRGLINHSILEDYDPRFNLSYILRPIAGFLTGFIAFFLLLGGALTFTSQGVLESAGWSTFGGRMPYLAVGLLAGYSSQVFMMKLKDISDAIFAPKGLKSHEKGSP